MYRTIGYEDIGEALEDRRPVEGLAEKELHEYVGGATRHLRTTLHYRIAGKHRSNETRRDGGRPNTTTRMLNLDLRRRDFIGSVLRGLTT